MQIAFTADLLIVGGGLLGTCAAMRAAEDGRQVVLLRKQDNPKPHAETQRNQAWHQSGINYSFGPDLSVARLMRRAGRVLLDTFGLELPPRGIMRLDAVQGAAIAASAAALGFEVWEAEDARSALGRCYRAATGSTYWRVPDGPFPEADAVALARNRARAAGAFLKETRDGIRLEEDVESPCGVVAVVEEVRVGAAGLLISAGAGTPALLVGLGVEDQLEAVRTPLLLVTHDEVLSAPLLVDRVDGFAITQPLPGRVTYGLPLHVPLPRLDGDARIVDATEQARLQAGFRSHVGIDLRRTQYKFDAGFELWRAGARGLDRVRPIVETHPRLERVVWALPGRATMAVAVADLALERLPPISYRALGSPVDLPGRDWDGTVAMYYEPHYDGQDDAEEAAT